VASRGRQARSGSNQSMLSVHRLRSSPGAT